MRSVENCVLLRLKVFWVRLGHALVSDYELTNWGDNMILDILYESVYKWCSNILDPALDPDIIVKEVSLAR